MGEKEFCRPPKKK